MRVSVFGLGKLGAPMAAVFASKGHHVVAVDKAAFAVERINRGEAPVPEPGLSELLSTSQGRLRATTDAADAVLSSDVSFVIVPTPSLPDGTFSLALLIAALEEIGRALRRKDGYHVVNITSTVMPGACDGPLREALESTSGREVGHDLGLTYGPEFIALGSVISDMLHPDVLLLGQSDIAAGDLVSAVTTSSVDNSPALQRMNLVNAELVKISVNTYVTTKISFANTLGEICQNLPGADADVVTSAVGADTRIGRKYLTAATAYGGPCFPRDNAAFAAMAAGLGIDATLARATDTVNRRQPERVAAITRTLARPGDVVAVLGLSYKPGTGFWEQSHGVALVGELVAGGVRVLAHDPLALEGPHPVDVPGAVAVSDLQAVLSAADVAVVTTAHPQYRDLSGFNGHTVLDCWGTILDGELPDGVDVVRLGRSTSGARARVATGQ